MADKKTLAIGIPAHNEEANIGFLIKALLEQESRLYVLTEIIVASDASTDKTVELVKAFNNDKVVVFDNKNQKGPSYRQKEIIERVDTDILLFLNADIMPTAADFLDALVEPIAVAGADLTVPKLVEKQPTTLFEKIDYAGASFKQLCAEMYKEGNNIYTCRAVRAYSKRLYTLLRNADITTDDAYSYLLCVQNNFRYKYVKKAQAIYRLPQSFNDYFKQGIRFFKTRKALVNAFGEVLVNAEFGFPKSLAVRGALITFLRYPLRFPMYVVVLLCMSVKLALYKKEVATHWETSQSTKFLGSTK